MEKQSRICTSFFKEGTTNKESYTAIWVTLISRLIRDRCVLASKEEGT